MRENGAKAGFFERFSGSVTDVRGIVYVLALVLSVLCLISAVRTDTQSGTASYLPADTNTGAGETIAASEFTELTGAEVFLENVSFTQCEAVRDELNGFDGVFSAELDDSDYDYGRAVIHVTLTDPSAVMTVGKAVEGYDGYVVTDGGSGWGIAGYGFDLSTLLLIAVACAAYCVALIFVSRAWGDMLVIFVTTAAAVVVNLGTNFVFGQLSRLTAVSCGIVQAALTLYYSAGVCRRYHRERKTLAPREAAASAMVHSMPRTLTLAFASAAAMGGLCFAMSGIGRQLGLAVIKGIAISVIMTIVLTPCLIVSRSAKMDHTRHNSLLPKIEKRGKFTYNTKTLFPVIFCLALAAAVIVTVFSPVKPYAYYTRLTDLIPVFKTQTQLTEQRIQRLFTGGTKDIYLLVPVGDYDKQQALTMDLEKLDRVVSVTGLTTIDVNGYHPADRITTNQLSEITGLERSAFSELLDGDAKTPFIDAFTIVYNSVKDGTITVAKDETARLEEIYRELYIADTEYHGDNYDKIKISMKLPIGTTAAIEAVSRVRTAAEDRYGDTVYLTGEGGSIIDLHQTMRRDTFIIPAAMAVILLIVLTVILRRPGQAAVVTFITVGGSVLTAAVPYLFPCRLLFSGQILGWGITAASLGAWGAVTAASYNKYKVGGTLRKGIGKSLKENYTLVTVSGGLTILLGVVLTFFGFSAEAMFAGIFMICGGVIGLLLALCVVPQALLIWDIIVSKITHTEIELTNDKYRDDDIVAAFEQLKSDIDDMRKGDEQ